MFITLEGPEGSGKTSQLGLLSDYLQTSGYRVTRTREPGGTSIGDQVRQILLSKDNLEMHPRTEIMLFQASRAQLVEQIILPRLALGEVVLCDRYADSTIAYQGYGHQLDLHKLHTIVDFATGGLKPDLSILLDLDVSIGLKRRRMDGDINRLDDLVLAFHQRVRAGYHQIVQSDPQRWVVIEADRDFDVVQQELREVVFARLENTPPRTGSVEKSV